MLYVFHGTDIHKSLAKAHALIDSLRTKRPDAAFAPVTGETWNANDMESHLGGQGLFSNKYIVFLDRVTENDDAEEQIIDFLEPMKESANIFIFLEGKVLTDLKKGLEKHAEKIVVSDLAESAKGIKKEFNVFALGDAIGARQAFKAWSVYREAIDNGLEPESIVGTLFWQVKSMIAAGPASTAKESGLNPFVFSKSKKYASNYSGDEMKKFARDLITAYHDAHRGLCDMELKVEQMLLSLAK